VINKQDRNEEQEADESSKSELISEF